TDTAQTLHDRLAALGGRLIVRALEEPLAPQAQNDALATYAAKIDKREAQIDWRETAEAIDRKIRAFNPAPGAASVSGGVPLKIWRARARPGGNGDPGAVLSAGADGITVACGGGSAL